MGGAIGGDSRDRDEMMTNDDVMPVNDDLGDADLGGGGDDNGGDDDLS